MIPSQPWNRAAPAGPDWQPGAIIDGRYQVSRVIGAGASAVVFQVRHLDWRIDLAVKTLKRSVIASRSGASDFVVREARTWTSLGLHPNIVQCWYVREIAGLPRIFMDLLPANLREWMALGRIARDDWSTILRLAIDIAEGIDCAHARGVIHRDIKPENLMMTPSGRVRVSDFGVSWVGHREAMETLASGASPATFEEASVAVLLGTPAYSAPELWIQEAVPTPASDIYSFGLVLYELACGQHPFAAAGVTDLHGLRAGGPVVPPRVRNPTTPPPLDALISMCLAARPEGRPRSCGEIAEQLTTLARQYDRSFVGLRSTGHLDPRADVLNNNALSFLDLSEPSLAAQSWLEAKRIDLRHPEASYNLALMQWRAAEITDAVATQLLEDAITSLRGERKARALSLLAWLHLERGDVRHAETTLKAAAEAYQGIRTDSVWQQASAEVAASSIPLTPVHRFVLDVEEPDGRVTPSPDGTVSPQRVPTRFSLQPYLHLKSAFRGPVNRMRVESDALIAGSTDEGVECRYQQTTLRNQDLIRYPVWALTYRPGEQSARDSFPSEAQARAAAPSTSGVGSGLVWASRRFIEPVPEDPRKFTWAGATAVSVRGDEFVLPRETMDALLLPGSPWLVTAHQDWMDAWPLKQFSGFSRDGFPVQTPDDLLQSVRSREAYTHSGDDEWEAVQVWDVATGRRLYGIHVDGGARQLLARTAAPGQFISVGRRQVALHSVDRGVPTRILYHGSRGPQLTAPGQPRRELPPSAPPAMLGVIDDHGHQLVVSTDGSLLVFDTDSWQMTREIAWPSAASVSQLALVSDQALLIALVSDGLEVIDLRSGRVIRTVAEASPIRSFAVPDDHYRLVTGHENGDVIAWHGLSSTGVSAPPALARGADADVFEQREREFSALLEQARTALKGGDRSAGATLLSRMREVDGYENDERALAVRFTIVRNRPGERAQADAVVIDAPELDAVTPDGRLGVAFRDAARSIIDVYTLSDGALLDSWTVGQSHLSFDRHLSISPNGRFAVFAPPITFLDLATGKVCGTAKDQDIFRRTNSMCVSSDGRHAFFKVQVRGGGIRRMPWSGDVDLEFDEYPWGSVRIALSPDDRHCIVATNEARYFHFDAQTGKCVRQFTGTGGGSQPPPQLLFAPDASVCLGHEIDGTTRFYDLSTGGDVPRQLFGPGAILAMTTQQGLVAGSLGQAIAIADYVAGEQRGVVVHEFDAASHLAVTEDGYVLSVHGSRTIARTRVVVWAPDAFQRGRISDRGHARSAATSAPLLRREANGIRHRSTLFFPASVGSSLLQEARPVAGAEQDLTIRYGNAFGSLLDLYVYRRGELALPAGIESRALGAELAQATSDVIAAFRQRGRGTSIEAVSTDIVDLSGELFVRRIFRANPVDGPVFITVLYLTACRDHFVKVRCTFPGRYDGPLADVEACLTGVIRTWTAPGSSAGSDR